MNKERHLRNYGLHSWSGITLGLFVYVICFTGSLTLFAHEIISWEDPAKRLPIAEAPAPMNQLYIDWLNDLSQQGELEFARFSYPDEHEPYFTGGADVEFAGDRHEYIERRWDTRTGEVLPERGDGLSRWILDFHRDLMWPQGLGGRTVGRTIVGVAGVVLLLSILTGVIAHTKIVKEFFTLRYQRSIRLKWQDTHKVLGLWGLPFFTMIAFTGAVLGVVSILAPIVALLTFKGDQQALIDEVVGAPVEAIGVPAEMLSVDDLASFSHPHSGALPAFVNLHNYGDENARFDLFYHSETKMMSYEAVQISGVSGEIIPDAAISTETPGNRAVAAMSPLHYGTYGGIALKLLYLALGLALSVVTVFGLMMWIERRLHGNEGSRSEAFYRRLSHMVTGVAVGLPLASIAIFHLDKLYTGTETARLLWTGSTFFIVWFVGLLYAFIRRNDYRTTRELIGLTGILMITAPIVNMVMTGGSVLDIFSSEHTAAAYVDLALFVFGFAILASALQLPTSRQVKTASKNPIIRKEILRDGIAE